MTRKAMVEPYVTTTEDDFNDEVAGYGTPVPYPAWFDQMETTEVVVGRDTAIVTDKVILPAGAVINHLSRVTRDDGVSFQVFGHPWRVHTPRGEHHVEAMLKAFTG